MKTPDVTDKRIPLAEAVMAVEPGMTVAFGGVTLYRRPVAFALQLARSFQGRNDLDLQLLCFTAGVESDLLVGAELVGAVRTCYFGLESFGLAPYFTDMAGQGRLRVIEESEASLAYGMRASLAGVGFMPSPAWQGTDLFELRPDVKTIQDPYTGETLTAFPAIRCDLAVVHALVADPDGNADIGQHLGLDQELALISDRVIVTAERIVPALHRAQIVAPVVDAVVETPGGAWPTSCHPLYPLDGEALLRYTETAGTDGYSDLIEQWWRKHHLTPGEPLPG